MARTVYMHVGVAKTGTTYLQRILYSHRDELRSAGLLYPGKRPGDQYVASIDLREQEQSKFSHLKAGGSWDRLAAEVRDFRGDAVVSHETFARCTTPQIHRVIESFGDAQLRVVLTVRDLARQIPAVWQETLKNKATTGYDDFLREIFVNVDSGEHKFFWKPQDVRKVVRRWGRLVGMDHLTVVTVPPSGAPRDELWDRFSKAIEVPDVRITLPEATANTSLGAAEAELLRYVNAALPGDFSWPRYSRAVKRQFAEQQLASRTTHRIVVPPPWHGAVKERSEAIVSYLGRSGCAVVGDLGDLEPALVQAPVSGPDDLSREQLMGVAGEVLRDYVLQSHRTRRRGRPVDVLDETPAGLRARVRDLGRRVKGCLSRAG